MSDMLLWTATASAQEAQMVVPDPEADQPVEIPPLFYWALWIPAFFVLVYMF